MPIRATLLAEIQAALGTTISPSLTTTSDPWDVYEAYILSIVLRAAQAEGAQIEYRTVNGAIPTTFIFRTGPGHMHSRRRQYCHAVLTFPNKPPLELHMSGYVSGKSRILHECDVFVLYQDEAQTCRNAPTPRPDPRSQRVVLSIECKFYSTTIGIGLGRAFIGLTADLSGNDSLFVYNVSSPNVEKFLTERFAERRWEHEVLPSNPGKVERLRNRIQSAFESFKATG